MKFSRKTTSPSSPTLAGPSEPNVGIVFFFIIKRHIVHFVFLFSCDVRRFLEFGSKISLPPVSTQSQTPRRRNLTAKTNTISGSGEAVTPMGTAARFFADCSTGKNDTNRDYERQLVRGSKYNSNRFILRVLTYCIFSESRTCILLTHFQCRCCTAAEAVERESSRHMYVLLQVM